MQNSHLMRVLNPLQHPQQNLHGALPLHCSVQPDEMVQRLSRHEFHSHEQLIAFLEEGE